MDATAYLGMASERFNHNAEAIKRLVITISDTQARWKSISTDWSILEVINHLYDEEREDFRQRLDLLLHHPEQPWPGIDPVGWVTERRYNERDLATSLANFLQERAASIAWLQSLEQPKWENSYHHPAAGSISAANLLFCWLGHDLLHLRQLTQLHWQYLEQSFPLNYAGDW